jgi:hypothetical protein
MTQTCNPCNNRLGGNVEGELQQWFHVEVTRADEESQAAKLYRGASPSNDGTELSVEIMPEGFPITIAPERKEEFSPGLDKELLELIQATAEVELKSAAASGA